MSNQFTQDTKNQALRFMDMIRHFVNQKPNEDWEFDFLNEINQLDMLLNDVDTEEDTEEENPYITTGQSLFEYFKDYFHSLDIVKSIQFALGKKDAYFTDYEHERLEDMKGIISYNHSRKGQPFCEMPFTVADMAILIKLIAYEK